MAVKFEKNRNIFTKTKKQKVEKKTKTILL